MQITNYSISAPYFINGHKNVTGMAMRDDMLRTINDQGLSDDRRAVERLLNSCVSAEDQALLGLTITSEEIEIDE